MLFHYSYYYFSRGTTEKLLDDKSFIQTHKTSMIDVAYNMMYEDEYDDTYDTSGLNMSSIDLRTVDELDDEPGGGKQRSGKVILHLPNNFIRSA